MKGIYHKDGCWHFDEYFAYLNEHLADIPIKIRDFITHGNTLHDSILLDIEYILTETNNRLIVKLKGPYFDRIFHFKFEGIMKIWFSHPDRCLKNSELITFQFGLLRRHHYRMEFIFDCEVKMIVDFEKLDGNGVSHSTSSRTFQYIRIFVCRFSE